MTFGFAGCEPVPTVAAHDGAQSIHRITPNNTANNFVELAKIYVNVSATSLPPSPSSLAQPRRKVHQLDSLVVFAVGDDDAGLV